MRTTGGFALLSTAFVTFALAQTPAPSAQQPEFVRRGQELVRSGNLDEALALYQAELKTSPGSVAANNGAGVVLDLLGRTKEAKTYFNREEMAADYWATVPDYFRQGEALNEAARVCIEAGALDAGRQRD